MVYKKKIFFDKSKKHYCYVMVFSTVKEMRDFYVKAAPGDKDHYKVGGVSIHRTMYRVVGKKMVYIPETGLVLLCKKYASPQVVAHEFMHAVLWARGHSEDKKQYPIRIKNIKEEEDTLYSLTEVLKQFYRWYRNVKNRL